MSTLYEYLNYLNETNLPPSGQTLPLQPNKNEELKPHDQAIKVCIEQGSISDEDGSGGKVFTYPSAPRCIQRRGSGNIILPLLSGSSECATPEVRSHFTLDEDDNHNNDSFYLTPHRVTSASTMPSEGGFKNSSSTQHLLSNSNLLTVTVCEGPFGLPDKNRRRSAIDLRSVTEMLSSSPLPTSKQQMSAQTSSESLGKSAAKLNIFGVLPNIRRASENALNKPNFPFLTGRKT